MSWNTKTLKFLESKMGYIGEITESYSSFSRTRKDFLGFLDAVALNPDARENKVLGIQITSKSNLLARYKKITFETVKNKEGEVVPNKVREKAKRWLKSGCGILIFGWETDRPKDMNGKIRKVFLNDKDEFEYKDLTMEMEEKNDRRKVCSSNRSCKSKKEGCGET